MPGPSPAGSRRGAGRSVSHPGQGEEPRVGAGAADRGLAAEGGQRGGGAAAAREREGPLGDEGIGRTGTVPGHISYIHSYHR